MNQATVWSQPGSLSRGKNTPPNMNIGVRNIVQ